MHVIAAVSPWIKYFFSISTDFNVVFPNDKMLVSEA